MPRKTDSEVEQWVLRELSLSERAYSREVCVLARDGVVRLQGSAQSDEDKTVIEETVRRAHGVVRVVNEMGVKPCTALIKRFSKRVPLTEGVRPAILVHRTRTQYLVAQGNAVKRAAGG